MPRAGAAGHPAGGDGPLGAAACRHGRWAAPPVGAAAPRAGAAGHPAGGDGPQVAAAGRRDPRVAAARAARAGAARHPAGRGVPDRRPAGRGVPDRRPAGRVGPVRRLAGPCPAGRVAPDRHAPDRPARRRWRRAGPKPAARHAPGPPWPARGGRRPGPAGTGRPVPDGRHRPTSAACRPRPGSPSTNGSWPPPPWRTAWQAGPWTGPQAPWRSHTPAGCSTRSHFLVIARAGVPAGRRDPLAQHSVPQCLDGGAGRHRVGHLQCSLDAAPPHRQVQAVRLTAQIGATTGRLPGRVVGDRPGRRTHDPMEGTLRGRRPAHHTRPPRLRPGARTPRARAPGRRLTTCNAW